MAYLFEMVGDVMEILTLLRANIRHKKGSFLSVILLTLLIAMSVTMVLSIQESTKKGVDNSHEIVDTPNVWVEYYDYKLDDSMIDQVKNNKNVEKVRVSGFLTGIRSYMGEEEYSNAFMMIKDSGTQKLLDEELRTVREDTPKLKKGELYVSQGYLTVMNGKVGERVTLETIGGEFTFTVKGILMDPLLGSASIGWKKFCISDEDYEIIQSAIASEESEDKHGIGKYLEIYKADDCSLTDAQFRRQLNLDTGIIDTGYGSLTRDMSIHYTMLFPEIICSVLLVFILFLLVIVLIITVHSISVEVETNYVTFGVLKAQGFGRGKIRMLFFLQYFIAEFIGSVLGILLVTPLVRVTSTIFVPMIAVPAVMAVPFGMILLILLALFVLSALSIWATTVKINRISPVRAISGGKKEIWFDSRIRLPISKHMLSPSLALRQFTSAKRRYVGTLAIVSILIFFMITISVLGNTITSKAAMELMGMIVTEVDITPKKALTDEEIAEIEAQVERFSKIQRNYYYSIQYFSFDGEEVLGTAYKNPEQIVPLKGRAPLYDNEIVITENLQDEFGLDIGDEVTIGYQGKKAVYLISGIAQLMNDAGRSFGISYDGVEKLDFARWMYGGYSIEEEEKKEEIADALNAKFGDILVAQAVEEQMDETYEMAINAMQLIIYVFSVLFALIVVHMVCSKAFVQERPDIGIYKGVGFTTQKLRIQFAVRFLVVAVIGAGIGSVFSWFFSAKILSMLLKSIGITNFITDFSVFNFVMPFVLVCVSFFVFAYLASRKVKKVEIRELVAE